MAFRQTYSRIENSEQSRVESTLEAVITINGQRMGRAQGVRSSGQANARPVQELGSDRNIEFVSGIKRFQGTIQSMTIVYGDLVRRLASMGGGTIDPDSKAATITNMPEFDVAIIRRGVPSYSNPQLYAAPGSYQDLAGQGQVIKTLIGCVIESFEQGFNVNESLIMESVSIQYIDEVINPQAYSAGSQLGGVTGGVLNV